MDFELSPEQKEIQALAREFSAAEIEPYAAECDREKIFVHCTKEYGQTPPEMHDSIFAIREVPAYSASPFQENNVFRETRPSLVR